MGEVWNEEQLEVTILTSRKVIMNKVTTLELVFEKVVFIQQCFVVHITNPIILGSNLLVIHFTVWDIGDCTTT